MLIEPDEIAAVMVANKWTNVCEGTFEVHTREWFRTDDSEEHWSFLFKSEQGDWITGPLDSIQAAKSFSVKKSIPVADMPEQRSGLGLRPVQ